MAWILRMYSLATETTAEGISVAGVACSSPLGDRIHLLERLSHR